MQASARAAGAVGVELLIAIGRVGVIHGSLRGKMRQSRGTWLQWEMAGWQVEGGVPGRPGRSLPSVVARQGGSCAPNARRARAHVALAMRADGRVDAVGASVRSCPERKSD